MAHEIENEMIAYANQVPWHGIGTPMRDDQSPAEFLKAAKLDWELIPTPLVAKMDDGTEVEVPNKSAFVRSSDRKIMTIASPNWTPLQNADALDFMTRYVNAGGAKMETAGALRDGQVVWGLARLNHSFETRPGDRVEGYLLVTTPHVVGRSIRVETTSVRVVCANTMRLAHGSSEVHYRQSHMKDFDVDAAREAVANAHEALATAERRARVLDQLKLTVEDAVRRVVVPVMDPDLMTDEELFARVMEEDVMPKRTAGVLESILNGPGATPDTGWGVLSGFTHYLDHVHGNSQATRFSSGLTGWGAERKLKAEELLLQMADAA